VRYALSPYIKQIRFVFKGLTRAWCYFKWNDSFGYFILQICAVLVLCMCSEPLVFLSCGGEGWVAKDDESDVWDLVPGL
jgi:hypothetical protein